MGKPITSKMAVVSNANLQVRSRVWMKEDSIVNYIKTPKSPEGDLSECRFDTFDLLTEAIIGFLSIMIYKS
jgi:hypothetical protein